MSRLSTNKQVNAKISVSGFYAEECIERNFDMGKGETAALMFDGEGVIVECNQAAAEFLDCSVNELTGQIIFSHFPELEKILLVHGHRAISCLRFLASISHRFDVVSMSGDFFASELYFSEVKDTGQRQLRVVIINSTMKN